MCISLKEILNCKVFGPSLDWNKTRSHEGLYTNQGIFESNLHLLYFRKNITTLSTLYYTIIILYYVEYIYLCIVQEIFIIIVESLVKVIILDCLKKFFQAMVCHWKRIHDFRRVDWPMRLPYGICKLREKWS